MQRSYQRRFILTSLWLGLFLFSSPAFARTTNSMVWRAEQDQVDAQIESWTFSELLENIATATGWQIYVEPDTEHTVSTRFQKLSAGDALRRLLGNLNFALLPQTNAPAKLFIYRTSLQEATQLIRAPVMKSKPDASSDKRIANELIVSLKSGARESIEELARRLGAKIVGRIDGLNTYRLQFEDEAAAKAARTLLSDNEDVGAVEYNYSIDRPARLEPLALSSTTPLSLKAKTGSDSGRVVIGLIDSAVQIQGTGIKDFLLKSLSVVGDVEPSTKQINHGTSMAETILRGLSLATEDSAGTPVRILPVDIYGNDPSTTTFEVAKGIYAAVREGATIINLSLGSPGNSSFLQNLIQEAHRQGVLFVAAAGNEPVTAPTFPAAYPEVIAVTAGDKKGNIASYANRGDFVDVIAPGSSIIQFNDRAYLGTGTSFSTAYVTGVAAALAASPGKTLAQVEEEVRRKLGLNTRGRP